MLLFQRNKKNAQLHVDDHVMQQREGLQLNTALLAQNLRQLFLMIKKEGDVRPDGIGKLLDRRTKTSVHPLLADF